jgi:plastocyanin
MVLGCRGYIFTLVTALMVMIILSMTLFYTEVSSPSFEDATNKVSLDELHYFVESIKKDASRAVGISSQRAAAYATDHVISTNETYRNYGMKNCTSFNYYVNGSEAAIAELMVCGSLENAKKPSGNIKQYMMNNTVLDWMDRINGNITNPPYNATVRFRNLTIAPYDSWHYIVFSDFDVMVYDSSSQIRYSGYGIPIVSMVDITGLEDPSPYTQFGIPVAVRQYKKCERFLVVNASVLDKWIDDECYQSVGRTYNAPSFIDRLEGNGNLSAGLLRRWSGVLRQYNYTIDEIGLESPLNLAMLSSYGVGVNNNLSQFDYMYWNGIRGSCSVRGMNHTDFRVDFNHATMHNITGLDCTVGVSYHAAGKADRFDNTEITVPSGTYVTFEEKSGTAHTLWSPEAWPERGEIPLTPYGTFSWRFNETKDYSIVSTPPKDAGDYAELTIHTT